MHCRSRNSVYSVGLVSEVISKLILPPKNYFLATGRRAQWRKYPVVVRKGILGGLSGVGSLVIVPIFEKQDRAFT